MKCTKCSREDLVDGKFCSHCGAPLRFMIKNKILEQIQRGVRNGHFRVIRKAAVRHPRVQVGRVSRPGRVHLTEHVLHVPFFGLIDAVKAQYVVR